MKLGIISPDLDACYIYRCMPFEKAFTSQVYIGKTGFQLWHSILNSDVIVMNRPFTSQQVEICKVIKECGKSLIIDWDDDLSRLPPWNPNRKSFEGCLSNLHDMAKLADAVTVTSKALAFAASQWGAKKVVLIPNAIDDSFKAMKRKPRQKIVLWRGSNTHSADLDVGRKTLTEMNATHDIIFVGDAPPWAYELRHKHIPVSDYAAYIATMNALAPEFVYVPLADHPFNHAKSDIGAQEAYLIGAKLMHNGIGEFAGLPESAEPRWLSDVNHLRAEVINAVLDARS